MPSRRSLGALGGVGEGISDVGKLLLQRSLSSEDLQKRETNDRMNQLLNDFDTSARAISTPEHVAKVGADVARTEYANLKRRLPQGVVPLIGQDPDFQSLDSTPDERQGDLTKTVGAITNPDDPALTPTGLRSLATAARVPTDVSIPMLGSSPASDAKADDPEFTKLLGLVQGQKEGLLAKEPTEASLNPLSGMTTFSTARQRNTPGFTTKTGLTAEEQAAKDKATTTATQQAETDVKNNPTNQQGAARGAGLIAGAQKRAELAAELASQGITGQQQTAALQMADDFEKASGDFFKIQSVMKQVQGLDKLKTGQADTGIIFGYMKALDPNSSVREGEAATVANAGSIPARVREAYNKAMDGTKLDDSVRRDVMGAMRTLYTSARKDHEDRVKLFTSRAQQLRVPPSLVIRTPSEPEAGAGALGDSPLARARAAAGITPKPTAGVD